MTQRAICIEFGPFIIKICEVQKKKKQVVEVCRAVCLQTPTSCVENGYVSLTDELVSEIRNVLHSWGQITPDLYISLQSDSILYRTRKENTISDKEKFIQEQEQFFADRGASYKIYIFENQQDSLVDIIGVPLNIFNCYIDLALCLNATLKGVVDSQYALRHNLCKKGANIFIDITEEKIMASIGQQQHIVAIKNIPHSIFPAMFTIKKYSNDDLDMVQALELLRQISEDTGYGLDKSEVIRELNSFIEALAQLIVTTAQDLRIAADMECDTIIISGFVADMPYLFKRLKQIIQCPVCSYKSVDVFSLHPDTTFDMANTFASCVSAFNPNINLLTPSILHTEHYNKYKRIENHNSRSFLQKIFH